LSNITSDGYIDRASTNLKSFYFSTAYLNNKTSLRLNIFSGKEKTYQAWNGVPESKLKTDRTYNELGTEKPGVPYDNQTDNYIQSHYQLFFNQQIAKDITFNTAIFLTRGKGYYEEYKGAQNYADYKLPYPVHGIDTTFTTDLVRDLWLDNYFYGDIFSFQYKTNKSQFILGGGWTRYDGAHYGNITWAQNGGLPEPNFKWYDLDAKKSDANIYFKQQTQIANYWSLFYDLQYRHVKYNLDGFQDNPSLLIHTDYNFFNPKLGVSYNRDGWNAYLSYSRAAKEPNRDDFEASAFAFREQFVVGELLVGVGLDAGLGDPLDLERRRHRDLLAVLLRVEERIGDEHRHLVAHLRRRDGVGEDQDVGHCAGS